MAEPARQSPRDTTDRTGGPPSGEAVTSTWRAPRQSDVPATARSTSHVTMGHRSTGWTACERCLWNPILPDPSTAKLARVRQPSPSGAPPTSSITTGRSTWARRRNCSATNSALRRRWAGRVTCCQSQPPHRPGPACGQGRATRSAEESSTSIASARRNDDVTAVTSATTRSPGSAWRTNTAPPVLGPGHAPAAGGHGSGPQFHPDSLRPSRMPATGRGSSDGLARPGPVADAVLSGTVTGPFHLSVLTEGSKEGSPWISARRSTPRGPCAGSEATLCPKRYRPGSWMPPSEPTGGNAQNWRFLLVDDPEVIGRIAPLYRHAIEQLWATIYADRLGAAAAHPDDPDSVEMLKVQRSAQWLADHFEAVPLPVRLRSRPTRPVAPSFPRVWSAQLAARAEGSGVASPWSSACSTVRRPSRSWASPTTSSG